MVALSVVVPIYNVERYLDECLRSLQVQTWDDLEVVMVDDGSPDGSAAIAARYAEQDPRFRLIQQENGGLGAARNTGIEHARGDFLTFVDSDDVIPSYAFGYHLESLRRSGSDFSSGNVHRLNELGTRQSPMHRRIFRTAKTGTHITREDTLLVDRLATNKVWRRSFWDRHGMTFPVGVLHEDIPVAIPLHFLAESVDVLSAPVYLWRERPSDDKSITQDRLRPQALEDRVSAVTKVSDFLRENQPPLQKRRWDAVALGSDLRLFLQVLDRADADFTRRLVELGNAYLDQVDDKVLRDLPAIERLKWHLIRQRKVEQLREVIVFNKSAEHKKAKIVRHGIRYYADYPFKDDPAQGVPRSVYRVRSELKLRQKAEELTWVDGKLVVGGRVCLKYLRPNKRLQQQVRAWAVNAEDGRRVRLNTTTHQANEFRLAPTVATSRKDWGGYRIVIDPAELGDEGDWYVELGVVNRGFRRVDRLKKPAAADVRMLGPEQVRPGVWARPHWVDDFELRLTVERPAVVLDGSAVEGSSLVLSGRATGTPSEGLSAYVQRFPGDVEVPAKVETDGASVRVLVDLAALTDGYQDRDAIAGSDPYEDWSVHLRDGSGRSRWIPFAEDGPEGRYAHSGLSVRVLPDFAGRTRVRVERPQPLLTAVSWDDDVLDLRGDFPETSTGELSLVVKAVGRMEEHLFPVEAADGRFSASVPPTAIPNFGTKVPLTPGNYRFLLRTATGDNQWDDRRIGFSQELRTAKFPAPEKEGGFDLELKPDGRGWPVLRLGSVLRPEEQGSYAQQVLREEVYPKLRRKPVQPGIVFDSYTGKQFSDSPRDMYEELRRRGVETPMSWMVRNRQITLPPGLTEVRHTSREYFEALARSEFIVSNAHLPMWFEKQPGQKVVQTWHGSMLKRIGFDIEHVQFAGRNYHDRLRHETNQWDYLVSPSPWATPILRRAFGFENEILETGYPRNDIFHRPEREAVTETVRERLGLPEGKKVILYAPTWRDDKFYSVGKYKLDLHLDLRRLYDALGDDHVLLFRRHPNIVDRVPNVGKDFVFDVSAYPEIQELFLVTDILITDYSSLMFDFANTGRPMLFFTYDLEEYRDSLRGFYFDFAETAPGPLLRTSDEVIDSIRDIDGVQEAHRERYEAFVNQFCPLDDGKAAARVVEQVFGKLL
ncbi:bifunctional glycosyltransferase/CDP-glycerol:glycerophosphate glycerophosphotransferase [Nocardiopsis dassonvillei]|uniref:bifunctional glycosyltransferase/CDP-glycerol:glycerophosphate glycerophosphotransferase n=1 Tax=Nocardiopsis dassonvillei TaxID=2014 RepID=UPI000B9D61C9|nr:bifunctional glycosyltransferase/CDP-glycerol:glycerophosphate glycerophosphotransferase [Nocardiopsis dassonvillei]ASU56671.1 CDP-glycerol--glycerophosphate glycerophosphotransferase [Nocardiopsis dassonvillei]